MVRLSGSRILGYESGFDAYGRGLDSLAEAGTLIHERKRQAEGDQQAREAHAKALEMAALRIKELEDEIANRPAERARAAAGDEERRADRRRDDEYRNRVFAAGEEERRRKADEDRRSGDAFAGALGVLGGTAQPGGAGFGAAAPPAPSFPPLDGRGPMLPTESVPGDLNGDGEIDEEERAYLGESENVFAALAPLAKNMTPKDRELVFGPLLKQRQNGLTQIQATKTKSLLEGMVREGALDEQRAADALAVLESGDPKAIAEEYKALTALDKAAKQQRADDNVRMNAVEKTDAFLAGLPALGIALTDEQELEIEDLRQDLVDQKLPVAKVLEARDKIRKLIVSSMSDSGGTKSGAKAWHEHPAVAAILRDMATPREQRIQEARALAADLGLEGIPAAPAAQAPAPAAAPRPKADRRDLEAGMSLEKKLGRKPSDFELAEYLRRLDGVPRPKPDPGQPGSKEMLDDFKARGVDFDSLVKKAGGQVVKDEPGKYTEAEMRRMRVKDDRLEFKANPKGGFDLVSTKALSRNTDPKGSTVPQ